MTPHNCSVKRNMKWIKDQRTDYRFASAYIESHWSCKRRSHVHVHEFKFKYFMQKITFSMSIVENRLIVFKKRS